MIWLAIIYYVCTTVGVVYTAREAHDLGLPMTIVAVIFWPLLIPIFGLSVVLGFLANTLGTRR